MVKTQTKVDGYSGEGEEDRIRRNWISTAIISISLIRVQTEFQTDVQFCYKFSRQVSGYGENQTLDNILVLFLTFQMRRVYLGFTAEY